MHGSQSFVSAFDLAISLRSFSFLSFSILVLWSLSPLGGQSSLRLLSKSNATVYETRPVYHPDPDANSWILLTYPITYVNQISVIVSSSISTVDTLQNGSVDAWNHPKVPRIAELENSNSLADRDDLHAWKDTLSETAATYTSLTGLSVVGLEPDTFANLTIPYAYMYANCEVQMRASARDIKAFFDTHFGPNEAGYSPMHPSRWPYTKDANGGDEYTQLFNVSYLTPGVNVYYESSFFLVSPTNLSTLWSTTGYVFYGTKDLGAPQRGISLYRCTLHDVEVDVNILCNSAACRTARLRRRASSAPPQTTNSSSDYSTKGDRPWKIIKYEYYLRDFIQYFPTIGGMITRFSLHPIDNYIYGNPNMAGSPTSYFTANPLGHNWSTVPDEQVSQRLTEIFNTYWEASRWMETTTRADPFALSSINGTSGEPFAGLRLNKTTAAVTRELPVYKASIPWILSLIICSGALFLLGLVNIYVAMKTSMPDILGAVSSLTRDNPNIDLPPGGSALDGMERTRLIKDMRVQLSDVQPEEEVGRIALRSIEKDEDAKGPKVERDRLYI